MRRPHRCSCSRGRCVRPLRLRRSRWVVWSRANVPSASGASVGMRSADAVMRSIAGTALSTTFPPFSAKRHGEEHQTLPPSWPGIAVRRTASLRSPMSRPSTSLPQTKQGVDVRIRGHDNKAAAMMRTKTWISRTTSLSDTRIGKGSMSSLRRGNEGAADVAMKKSCLEREPLWDSDGDRYSCGRAPSAPEHLNRYDSEHKCALLASL
jgi:hypothetical protein